MKKIFDYPTHAVSALALAAMPALPAEPEIPELAKAVAASQGFSPDQIIVMSDGSTRVRVGFEIKPLLVGCHSPNQPPPREQRSGERPAAKLEEDEEDELGLAGENDDEALDAELDVF